MSVDDIAAATGVSFETAKSRLRYARNKLKNCSLISRRCAHERATQHQQRALGCARRRLPSGQRARRRARAHACAMQCWPTRALSLSRTVVTQLPSPVTCARCRNPSSSARPRTTGRGTGRGSRAGARHCWCLDVPAYDATRPESAVAAASAPAAASPAASEKSARWQRRRQRGHLCQHGATRQRAPPPTPAAAPPAEAQIAVAGATSTGSRAAMGGATSAAARYRAATVLPAKRESAED